MFFDYKAEELTGELYQTTRENLIQLKKLIDVDIIVLTEQSLDVEISDVCDRFEELATEKLTKEIYE